MSIIRGKVISCLIAIIIAITFNNVCYAANKITIGPFYLGMAEVEFEKITNKSPENCATCEDEETYIGLYKNEIKQVNLLPIDYVGIDFYFIRSKLNKIEILIKEKHVTEIRKVYKSIFDMHCSSNKYSDDVVELICSDKSAAYTFLYNEKDELVYVIKYSRRASSFK